MESRLEQLCQEFEQKRRHTYGYEDQKKKENKALVIGSTALKHGYPSLPRRPKDIDLLADPFWVLSFYRKVKGILGIQMTEFLQRQNLALSLALDKKTFFFDVRIVTFQSAEHQFLLYYHETAMDGELLQEITCR